MAEEEKGSGVEEEPKERVYDLSLASEQVQMFRDGVDDEKLKQLISSHIQTLITGSGVKGYKVILLYDPNNSISSYHSNKIYQSITEVANKSDVLMIIESGGGQIEPAYLISKTCKRLSKKKFCVSIPRKAKSAATLISLGATELHMGLLSELGPIDPQFGGFPALGLSNAVEKIAEMTEKFPTASDMLAKYLTDNVSIRDLGYFERINESAAQYAERLLNGKNLPEGQTCKDLADHFTNHYKDHGFVIDADEAAGLLGNDVVKENTKEYQLGNSIYEFLHFIGILYEVFKDKRMRYVGGIDDGIDLTSIEK